MSTVRQESSPSSAVPSSQAAAWGFRALVVIVGAACVAAFWQANAATDEYRLRYPVFMPWFWNLYLSFYVGAVVAAIGLWNWRKWGLYLLAAMAIGMMFTEFYAMGFQFAVLRIPLVFLAVWLGSQPIRDRLT